MEQGRAEDLYSALAKLLSAESTITACQRVQSGGREGTYHNPNSRRRGGSGTGLPRMSGPPSCSASHAARATATTKSSWSRSRHASNVSFALTVAPPGALALLHEP
jgi:hypothetical protein